MKIERDIERKIKQKEEEVQQLRSKLLQAEAYMDALQESLRMIKRTSNVDDGKSIRPGSMIHKAMTLLRRAKTPMHVTELLEGMGKEPSKNNKTSLSGSLGLYVRQGIVFSRPAPNTFGLLEYETPEEDDLPETFGG